ncbi:MAG: hypothetical protein N3A00_03040 [Thermodesulfovibrio sp.]|nr:hypothetical protein [Thermodesulfovibrio sp.]
MSTFITNSGEKSLKKRLQTLISKSEELKFLIGFFYFSGIRELKIKSRACSTDISFLESQIDNLVYKLYNLTEEEIKIVEGLNNDNKRV